MMALTPQNGTLYVTVDKNFAISESFKPNSKVLFIDDIEKEFYTSYNNPNMINSALLLPPYKAMCEYDMGNDNNFEAIYNQHISTVCKYVISGIILCLCKGNHLMIYTPEHIFPQVEYLLGYLSKYHGIICGSERGMYNYNSAMNDDNIRYMYFMNHISAEEVVANIDIDCLRVDSELLNRLIYDIQPVVKNNTMNDYIEFFNIYKYNMLNNGNILTFGIRFFDSDQNI